MRKLLFLVVLLLQLTAATAFAYTNKEDGFKTLSPSSGNYVEAVGKHFYGYVDDNGQQSGYAETLTSEQAGRFLGAEFTTAAFNQKYNDILLLQRNGISNSRIKSLLAEPVVTQLFNFNKAELTDYIVSAQKFGKNKYIAVTINMEPGAEPVTLYYTSDNDKLYMLMAEQQMPLKAADEATIGIIGGADASTGIFNGDKTGDASVAGKNFLQKFKTIKPQKNSQPFSFDEKTAAMTIAIPENWFYVQLADNRYNEEDICVTAAMPLDAMNVILKEALNTGITGLEAAVTASQAADASSVIKDNKNELLDIFRHGIIIFSVKSADGNLKNYLFDNPNKTAYSINKSIEELKAYLNESKTEFKTFNYNVDVKDGQGNFYLQTEVKPYNTDFYYNLRAEGSAIGNNAYIALIFDRDDGIKEALELWQKKILLHN